MNTKDPWLCPRCHRGNGLDEREKGQCWGGCGLSADQFVVNPDYEAAVVAADQSFMTTQSPAAGSGRVDWEAIQKAMDALKLTAKQDDSLDVKVAKALGWTDIYGGYGLPPNPVAGPFHYPIPGYSTDWIAIGALIERFDIGISTNHSEFYAYTFIPGDTVIAKSTKSRGEAVCLLVLKITGGK